MEEISLQHLLEALADPVRRQVVSQPARAGEDLSCGTFDAPVSRSTLTHHFNVLREAGVIRQYYVGTAKMNTLRADEMEERFPGLLSALVTASTLEAGPPHPRAHNSMPINIRQPSRGHRRGPPGRPDEGRPGRMAPTRC
ncbi:ArsR/SmtB family transcription factor [Streptomyces sp. NPDC020480]|uniref:ArsR/SmtB family transcription factor n=1 Tax=Streptomyces sp. NPDC020480 TaxID=3365076 RepID=UPI003788EECB